jgi:hypothetical protein
MIFCKKTIFPFVIVAYSSISFGQINALKIKYNLVGIWINNKDHQDIMKITSAKILHFYKKIKIDSSTEFDTYSIFTESCDSEYSPITDGRKQHFYLATKNNMCYEIDDLDQNNLTLIYTAGKILMYHRQIAKKPGRKKLH